MYSLVFLVTLYNTVHTAHGCAARPSVVWTAFKGRIPQHRRAIPRDDVRVVECSLNTTEMISGIRACPNYPVLAR